MPFFISTFLHITLAWVLIWLGPSSLSTTWERKNDREFFWISGSPVVKGQGQRSIGMGHTSRGVLRVSTATSNNASPTPPRTKSHLNRPPEYPSLALDRGLEGEVLLQLFLSETGEVTWVRLAKSSGHKILDEAAQTAAWDWRFSQLDLRVPHLQAIHFRID